ncbi:LamG domain-containing protein [Lacipirellula sp.]|uniref:LamG domain-containing protein n=1 Tax=Lacipirellula sp. TaxID=2691419 RepID=UPI003D1246E7
MNTVGHSKKSAARRLLLAAGTLAVFAASAEAGLVHKYTFNNGNANDSVGTANGEVIDRTGISSYTGGALDLTRNNNANSNQDFSLPTTVGAYVDLPNGVFSSAMTSGAGAATLEIWATPQENRNWARLVDFGTSNGGENTSGGAGASAYVLMTAQQSINGQASASVHSSGGVENFAHSGAPLATGVKSHMVAVFDHTNITAGPNGTLTLYVNNGTPVTAAIPTGIDLTQLNDNNNWLGRAQWPDPLFDGLIDEFRIYDNALTAAQVAASFAAGPEPAPVPVLTVNRSTGVISLSNQSGGGINVTGYSIGSVGGGLNPATWTSIDAGNTFDPNGTWTSSSSTNLSIAESVTGGTLDGGTIAGNGSASIGAAWKKTPIEDLTFTYTMNGGATGAGQIVYTGTAAKRSDLNGDGLVNAADWAVFVPNSSTAFAADPAVTAYLKGDLDGDKDNDYADFKLFKADFIAANGEAAFAALGAAVPEPATLGLAGLASVALVAARRRAAGK